MGKAIYSLGASQNRVRNLGRKAGSILKVRTALVRGPIPPNYEFIYDFNNGVIADSSGFLTTAVGYNVAYELVDGDYSAVFNGSTSYVRSTLVVPNDTSYNFEVRFYMNVMKLVCLFCDDDGSPGYDFYVRVQADGSILLNKKDNTTLTSPPGLIVAGKWYVLNIVSTPARTEIFLDGVSVAHENVGVGNIGYHSRFVLGCRHDNFTRWWDWLDGKISYISYSGTNFNTVVNGWERVNL